MNMQKCLVCGSPVETFISFGRMPIANGFLSPEHFAQETFFKLKAGFCPTCFMVQLTDDSR
jgi:methylation protein EvaC